MKVASLLEQRRPSWAQLEDLCKRLEARRTALDAQGMTRFASLYRSACADLALADGYQLPADTVRYLHHLVGRAHNQLYRSRGFRLSYWAYELLYAVPQRLFHDGALRLATVVFWGLFLLGALMAYTSREFVEEVVGKEQLTQMHEMYSEPLAGRDAGERAFMVGFYIRNNAGIGLQCFAYGLLGGIGGLVVVVANALTLGAVFGHMATVPQRENFYTFVTAHGPFELTAIVVSAAAGMRLGFSLVSTGGLSRRASLEKAARETMPTIGVAVIMFVLAALIEAFVSPSALPYWAKAMTAAFSSAILLFYFVLLGHPNTRWPEGWSRPPAEPTPLAATD